MNELEEFNYINNLYDIYRNLFTSKQIEIMDNYFKFNLSLSEISENLKISRSAVLDTINHSKNKLFQYEKSLNLYARNKNIEKILDDEKIDKEVKDKILKEL